MSEFNLPGAPGDMDPEATLLLMPSVCRPTAGCHLMDSECGGARGPAAVPDHGRLTGISSRRAASVVAALLLAGAVVGLLALRREPTSSALGGVVGLVGGAVAAGSGVRVVQTSQDTHDRLSWKPDLTMGADFAFDGAVVDIDASQMGQEILGFGGAFTESAATVFSKLPPTMQEVVIEKYFGASGLGYTMGRVHINSCDFALDSYSFDETKGDFGLEHFDTSVAHDKTHLIPLIRRAAEKVEGTVADAHLRIGGRTAGPWESLQVSQGPLGEESVALQTHAGKILSTGPNGVVEVSDLKAVGSASFKLKEPANGVVTIVASNGKYVTISKDGSAMAVGDANSATKFGRVFNADGTMSLRDPLGRFLTTRPQQLRLLASPWSPPAWMKKNGAMDGTGDVCLKKEAQGTWAKYISKWVSSYTTAGVPIWGLTVQNEPSNRPGWEACTMTPQEEAEFLGSHLGPTLAAEHPDLSIFAFDDSKHLLPDYVAAIASHPAALKYMHGAAFHWYSGDFFDKVGLVHQQHPELKLLASEAAYERRMWKPGMVGPYADWRFGEGYAHDIIGDLNAGASGWLDWNLLLDDKGGPNHVGNVCDAALVADAGAGLVDVHPQYYFIGHFSKFLVPGSKHIGAKVTSPRKYKPSQKPGPYGTCTGDAGLEVTAVLRPDGQIAAVVLNCAAEDIEFKLKVGQAAAKTTAPRRSITTFLLAPS